VSSLASVRVGRYFTAGELDAAATVELPGLGALAALFLDPLRELYGVATVVSGKRTVQHNASVGGAADSRHVYSKRPLECAADVTFARGTSSDWFRTAIALANSAGRGGVGRYISHLHVDVGPRRTWSK
jgi:uncharacterized protein YcbK (DUF882 family)